MNAATAQHFYGMVVAFAAVDHLHADFNPDLMDHTEDVAFGWRCLRSDHKIGSTQSVKVYRMVCDIKCHVEQLADFLSHRRGFYMVESIQCFRCSNVMCFRTDTADTVCYPRHFLSRSSHTKLFEAAQLRNLEVYIINIALIG